jgi:hypothetical protein
MEDASFPTRPLDELEPTKNGVPCPDFIEIRNPSFCPAAPRVKVLSISTRGHTTWSRSCCRASKLGVWRACIGHAHALLKLREW